MFAINKILLPVDFSPNSAAAARYAAALATHFQAELTMLHVCEPLSWIPPVGWENAGEFYMESLAGFDESRRRQLDTFAQGETAGLDVKRVLLPGDPARTIVDQAHRTDTDLIVMPTRGCGAFRRLLFGSVAAKVLHDAECPVWTGVHLENATRQNWKVIRNVLCAIDNGPRSEEVLHWAKTFTGEFGARLTVMHAIPALAVYPAEYLDPNWWGILADEARQETMAIVKQHGVSHGPLGHRSRRTRPRRQNRRRALERRRRSNWPRPDRGRIGAAPRTRLRHRARIPVSRSECLTMFVAPPIPCADPPARPNVPRASLSCVPNARARPTPRAPPWKPRP